MPLLEINHLTKYFGGVHAVRDVSLTVEPLSITAIIGPNGAGKSTVLNLISGLYKPTLGEVIYEGRNIAGMPAYELANLSIARTFQLAKSFPEMNVVDAVSVAQIYMNRINLFDSIFKPKKVEMWKEERKENSLKALMLVGLERRANEKCKNLPHGEQMALEMAIAVATEAKLLLLDEPASGLNSIEIITLMETLKNLKNQGVTILIV